MADELMRPAAPDGPPNRDTALRGRKPGDRRVPVHRATSRYFRYTAPGVFAARLSADDPRTPSERWLARGRRILFGRPLASEEELAERLPIWKALPVFSSDVMSSVAYATEASLYTLLAAGAAAFWLIMPISAVIVAVLALVTISYRQTIRAYPGGGGSYIVAHANLGELPGLVAAAALLVDYVLTVAVSVSAGVFALNSLFPALTGITVPLIAFFILLVMAVNLRGLRESGTAFATPTYLFLLLTLALITVGVIRTLLGDAPHVTGVIPATGIAPESLGLLLVMRAFADGCSAMTGTEAVTNGVPAFKPPEWKNAQITMGTMAVLLGTVFLGVSFLARVAGAMPSNSESVLSQIGRSIFGPGPLWWLLQLSTTGILILAAQTSFADFPRLSSILAKDGYFPRQFAFRGERLAFNAGIVALAALSIVLVVAFQGRTERLIPLYAVGVFTAFTLSQAGMVRHWFKERSQGWRRSAVLNGLGAATTSIVVVIFAIAKFALGAWIVIVIVPVLVLAMLFVRREYLAEGRGLAVRTDIVFGRPRRAQRVIVAAPAMTRAVVQAVKVAATMSQHVEIVHVTSDLHESEEFRARVQHQLPDVGIVVVESPYRSLVRPFVRYLEVSAEDHPGEVTVVLLPEHLPRHWWDRLLYNQNVNRIRAELVGRRDIVVLDVPYRRDA